MTYINPNYIKRFFDGLNSFGIEYVLIKNVGNELPFHLRVGKDIDIVVHNDSLRDFHRYMSNIGRKIIHPYGKETGWTNLYQLPEFEYWRLNTADNLFIDVSSMLCCHSLMPNIWLPLDRHIQEDMWSNKIFDNDNNWWKINNEILYVYLVVRCVFDKKQFPDVYKKEIETLRESVNIDKVKFYFEFVFFKYTRQLLSMLDNKDFDSIISAYLKYKEY